VTAPPGTFDAVRNGLARIFRGVWRSMAALVAVLEFQPLALWLPGLMK
jgi:hypothetical protein